MILFLLPGNGLAMGFHLCNGELMDRAFIFGMLALDCEMDHDMDHSGSHHDVDHSDSHHHTDSHGHSDHDSSQHCDGPECTSCDEDGVSSHTHNSHSQSSFYQSNRSVPTCDTEIVEFDLHSEMTMSRHISTEKTVISILIPVSLLHLGNATLTGQSTKASFPPSPPIPIPGGYYRILFQSFLI